MDLRDPSRRGSLDHRSFRWTSMNGYGMVTPNDLACEQSRLLTWDEAKELRPKIEVCSVLRSTTNRGVVGASLGRRLPARPIRLPIADPFVRQRPIIRGLHPSAAPYETEGADRFTSESVK